MANFSARNNVTHPLSPPCSDYSLEALTVSGIFGYVLLIIVALTGNFLIGLIVFKTKSMHRTINYLIVNMAMSDLIIPILAFTRVITEKYIGHWIVGGPFGLVLCKLLYFFLDASTAVSVLSLTLIAVDRFGAIVFPFRPPIVSSKRCPCYIIAIWVIAMALHSPYLAARKISSTKGKTFCTLEWTGTFGMSSSVSRYFVSMFLVLVLVPFTVMIILYSVIIAKVKLQRMPKSESVNAKEQQKRIKRERNVLNMALAIVLGFALCWAPFNIIGFLYFFVWDSDIKNMPRGCAFQIFFAFASFTAHANCALNPCICFCFSENYRRALKSIFTFCPQNFECSCCGPTRKQSWNVKTMAIKESGLENVTMTSLT